MSRRILVAAYEGAQSLDIVGPFEVFAGANAVVASRGGSDLPYDVRIVADATSVRTESGLALGAEPWPTDGEPVDTLIVPGGGGVYAARCDADLMQRVRSIGSASRRFATVCSGTFIGAEAGLLDGRTVTTHWARAGRLAAEYPALQVDPDPIYLHDGRVWTSAGVTAGIDLALALVDDDLGGDIAQTAARWLVMFRHRPGGQSQFAVPV